MGQWKGRSAVEKFDPYKKLATQFIAMIESGNSMWQRPWDPVKAGLISGLPRNAVTNRPYNGGNAMLLSMVGGSSGDPRFMTKKQILAKGYTLKENAPGYTVYFWKFVEKKKPEDSTLTTTGEGAKTEETKGETVDLSDRDRYRPVMWLYTVFNGKDIDGLPPLAAEEAATVSVSEKSDLEMETMEKVMKIIDGLSLKGGLHYGGTRAFYSPSDDRIVLPPKESFRSWVDLMGTLTHEGAHATGAKGRLDFLHHNAPFGSELYAMEELRAEMAASALCQILGVPMTEEHLKNHAGYLKSWVEVIGKDPKELYRALSGAQKGVEYALEHAGLPNPWKVASDNAIKAGADPNSEAFVFEEEDEAIPVFD